ncbi:MAG: hypothetical protein U0T32_11935 [Chitinophagales bacterium]
MGLVDKIKKDIEKITSNSKEFGVEMTLTAPTHEIIIIKGLHTKHHLSVGTDGSLLNSKNAHVSFSEKFLTDSLYPVRNTSGEVDLKNHRVDVKDSTGVVKKYLIQHWFPDETVGLIVCILEDFADE